MGLDFMVIGDIAGVDVVIDVDIDWFLGLTAQRVPSVHRNFRV